MVIGRMHTLSRLGVDIACSRRWQRLCMHMAEKPSDEQQLMEIRSGHPNRRVTVLR